MKRKKIAIIGLCHHKTVRNVLKRNSLISQFLKCSYDVDNIIFNDRNFAPNQIEKLKNQDPGLKFVNIWDNPTKNLLNSYRKDSVIGYKGMCLFYGMEFIHYLAEYDYCIRLDDDSFLRSGLDVDSFIDNGLIYGYIHEKEDIHEPTKKTFPPAVLDYIKSKNIKTLCKEKDINVWHHYSNFWITDLNFWRKQKVKDYFDHIYSLNGIKKWRWGDHVILSNALRMFCPKEKMVKLNFKYEHESHKWKNF
jgi:hypothetical protein